MALSVYLVVGRLFDTYKVLQVFSVGIAGRAAVVVAQIPNMSSGFVRDWRSPLS